MFVSIKIHLHQHVLYQLPIAVRCDKKNVAVLTTASGGVLPSCRVFTVGIYSSSVYLLLS